MTRQPQFMGWQEYYDANNQALQNKAQDAWRQYGEDSSKAMGALGDADKQLTNLGGDITKTAPWQTYSKAKTAASQDVDRLNSVMYGGLGSVGTKEAALRRATGFDQGYAPPDDLILGATADKFQQDGIARYGEWQKRMADDEAALAAQKAKEKAERETKERFYQWRQKTGITTGDIASRGSGNARSYDNQPDFLESEWVRLQKEGASPEAIGAAYRKWQAAREAEAPKPISGR